MSNGNGGPFGEEIRSALPTSGTWCGGDRAAVWRAISFHLPLPPFAQGTPRQCEKKTRSGAGAQRTAGAGHPSKSPQPLSQPGFSPRRPAHPPPPFALPAPPARRLAPRPQPRFAPPARGAPRAALRMLRSATVGLGAAGQRGLRAPGTGYARRRPPGPSRTAVSRSLSSPSGEPVLADTAVEGAVGGRCAATEAEGGAVGGRGCVAIGLRAAAALSVGRRGGPGAARPAL